jgi:hypothetical protein
MMQHTFVVVLLAEVAPNNKDVVIELGGVNQRSTPFHVARSDVPNLLSGEPTPARRERANGHFAMVKLQTVAEVGRDTIRVIEEDRATRDYVFVGGWFANLVRAIKEAIA